MSETLSETVVVTNSDQLGNTKNRSQFTRVLGEYVRKCNIDVAGSTLIVGGSLEDIKVLRSLGFQRMTLSNFQPVSQSMIPPEYGPGIDAVCADVEDMDLPDNSYDFVIAHEVLHHCRSPHIALLEMLRVCRRHVVILEPNDSLFMSTLVKLKLSLPYELTAVVHHNFESGGVRDSCVPNFLYRWSRNDVFKTVSSFIPELQFKVHAEPYWDFNIDGAALARRKQTRLGILTKILGPEGFLRTIRAIQPILNSLPLIHGQGNKFFCCIEKKQELKPWLDWEGNEIVFNRKFVAGRNGNNHR
ncbi:MAG TPA: methyltransferase domain-containing protein [Candidatus Sulfotelmatobacter sp.]|jgi:SAM-dependent methyltransferase|nr:methyltransferase domain-containing protein [Candidatus Sulfotelmatobacter sp.]